MKVWSIPFVAGCLAIAAGSIHAQSPISADSPAPEVSGTTALPPDFSKIKTADDFWAVIQRMEQGLDTAASPDEAMSLLEQLPAATAEFQKRYPKDQRRWQAKLDGIQLTSMLQSARQEQPDADQIEKELKEVAYAPDAPADARAAARFNIIGLHIGNMPDGPLTPAIEAEVLAFIHDFPDDPGDADLQKARFESLAQSDPGKATQFLNTLLKDKNPAVQQMAGAEIAMIDLPKKPFDLKFTATDGTKVDVSKMRGKVVLIDFWATWCGPCMEAVPDEVKLYNEYHSKGLEIVGISLDEDVGPVEGVTKAQGMVWPQYFDGKGTDNAISAHYGVTSIPTLWLIDKKGMVVDTDAADGLEDKVAKLLAE
jgi:thiol-disulfide isomerase/thioredoxin